MKGYVVVKRDSMVGSAKQVAKKHYDRYYVCRVTATEVVE